ncbi:NusB antitermination factor [Chloroherpeton thalassium ATCC 35110]|uniref:Transcription antitermination protein NusB n=1 Tax=Chloroherpeton thalassium (strain ATCC 35110 / GB-78) TaxID=517418 RepID=NUSB_CHLT3|nr:RecName: Full=Transcription antitermination protein NusB; AltName: Full=Antitermination factor NusB [Chloroherpeton thalassium ATCC 35110]ACF13026.1 NusB antitermination factor [Chloroherpeton thalassium ATCC 35110]
MIISRRQIRELAMQVLYAYEVRKEKVDKVAKGIIPEDVVADIKAKDFIFKIINSVIQNIQDIDTHIAKHADNWELNRMAIIDKNLMRIAIAEMLYLDDVPPKVSINEAIEIAKRYSTDKSSKFVNGILDATYNEVKSKGVLHKSGRGLVDLPAKKERVANPFPSTPPKKPENVPNPFSTPFKKNSSEPIRNPFEGNKSPQPPQKTLRRKKK